MSQSPRILLSPAGATTCDSSMREPSERAQGNARNKDNQCLHELLDFPEPPNLYSHCFMSTRRPRKRTPSASNRSRCSTAGSPRSLISPPAPRTRCQGNPNPRRKTAATCRAAPGKPAARAIPPYVDTLPCGIVRIVCSMRKRATPGLSGLVFAAGEPRLLRFTVQVPRRVSA